MIDTSSLPLSQTNSHRFWLSTHSFSFSSFAACFQSCFSIGLCLRRWYQKDSGSAGGGPGVHQQQQQQKETGEIPSPLSLQPLSLGLLVCLPLSTCSCSVYLSPLFSLYPKRTIALRSSWSWPLRQPTQTGHCLRAKCKLVEKKKRRARNEQENRQRPIASGRSVGA